MDLKFGGNFMYVILVYDVDKKRCGKMLKLCRRYLNHIQNSVFEGEITEARLEELKIKANKIMKKETQDSLIVFKSRNEKWLNKEIVGIEKKPIENIL
jgi:CRISPR-associated protein Cas2